MNKTFAALFAAVALAFASSAVAVEPPAGPLKLPAKPGSVTFQHKTHAKLKCTQCHADDKGGAIEGFNKTVNKDKAHAKCHDCHKKEAKGPQKCADCHKKA
ncbi:MAG TPA: cytochrome c3 family protein [Anaeromyxobacter sp.]|nr:cytochrome c3 family protein [Anaeromyxobacter sp.]